MSPIAWVRQVRHVARKDLRSARWALRAFVASTTVSTFFGRDVMLAEPMALVSGLVLAAVLMQADPPAGRHAFWAGTPLRPSAVLGAKLLLSFGLILGADVLSGLFVTAAYHRMPTGDILGFVWRTVAAYGAWILAVLVFAAVFRAFASVVVAVVLTAAAGPLARLAVSGSLPESVAESAFAVARSARPGLFLLTLTAGLLLLSYLYRSHDERRRWSIVGVFVAFASTVLVSMAGPSAIPSEAESLPNRGELDGIVPGIQDIRYLPGENGPLRIRMTVRRTDPIHRYSIVPESARLVRADGSEDVVPIELFIDSGDIGPPESAARRWLDEQRRGPTATDVRLQLEVAEWDLVRVGQSNIEVTIRVELLEPRRVAALPIEISANAAGRGTRIEISGISERADDFLLQLSTRTLQVYPENAPTFEPRQTNPRRGYGYALIHEERGEGIALLPRGGGASSGPFSIGMPALGTGLHRSSFDLGPRESAAGPPGQEWLREARLHVFDWVPAGARQLAVRTRLRPVPRRPQ